MLYFHAKQFTDSQVGKKNCYNKIKFQTPVNSKANSNQNKLNNDKDKQGTLEP